MSINVVFTICAKNYLAQALTLKESYSRFNDTDFVIFLSDKADAEQLPEVVELSDEWIPGWESMAFKYNVIEFSTSIKPFCIQYLFDKGYQKVVYLDPDIYVCNNLNGLFMDLEDYSIVLTPHRCCIDSSPSLFVQERMISAVGIYNLGFIAIKNNQIGQKVVGWWKEKLSMECYNDFSSGLFVDQKWMDFIPGFYPNDVLISTHLGMNVATWNLNERQVLKKDDKWIVQDLSGELSYDLLFFHFSGYSPLKPGLLDKRMPHSDLNEYQTMKELAEEYRSNEMKNDYGRFSKMRYSFNYFSNNVRIDDLHRKFYPYLHEGHNEQSPFDANGSIYQSLNSKGLLPVSKRMSLKQLLKRMSGKYKTQKIGLFILNYFGFKKYSKLIQFFKDSGTTKSQLFLLK